MKKEELKKLRGKTPNDLLEDLKSFKNKLWQLRLDVSTGKVKNISEIRKTKKAMAIINTILNEK